MHQQGDQQPASVICATGTVTTNGNGNENGGSGDNANDDCLQGPIDECFNGNFLANPDDPTETGNNQLTTNGRRSPPNEFEANTTVVSLGKFDQDIVRIIGQHLLAIGLKRSADLLMAESGTRLDHQLAAQFRRNVLDGNWTKAGHDLELLKPYLLTNTDEESIGVKGVGTGCFRIDTSAITRPTVDVSPTTLAVTADSTTTTTTNGTNGSCSNGNSNGNASNGADSNGNQYAVCNTNGSNGHIDSDEMDYSECTNPTGLIQMKYLILEQKYLECLEDNRLYEALHVLRTELTPLRLDTQRVHLLSSYIMCSHRSDLLKRAKWDGKGLVSRTKLIDKLQKFLPPNMMLPPRRLLTILEQSLGKQIHDCIYHNLRGDLTIYDESLLSDHACTKDTFPATCMQVLSRDHVDEVWFCQFSPDGTKLATGSKDTHVIIWDVHPETCTVTVRRSLDVQSAGAAVVNWSPDSIHLIVCGPEDAQEVWLWNTETNKHIKISQSSDDVLTTCAWNKEGTKFVVGGIRGHFYHCDLEGNITDSWEGVRVTWLHYRHNETKQVLAADSHFRIRSYNFDELSESLFVKETHSILTFSLDKKEQFAALNVMGQGIHLYDVKTRSMVRKLRGLQQNTFRIHSCFGGRNHEFVASGSEDNKVYIWNIVQETPIAVLSGHTRTVNCVHWNPVYTHMLASVSDDTTVRIWGPSKLAEANSYNEKYFGKLNEGNRNNRRSGSSSSSSSSSSANGCSSNTGN